MPVKDLPYFNESYYLGTVNFQHNVPKIHVNTFDCWLDDILGD